MPKRKIMYRGVDPVYVVSKPDERGLVKIKFLDDVWNDTGTIVRHKGDTTVTSENNITSRPLA